MERSEYPKFLETTEINPQQIAASLRGRLEPSYDLDSTWNIFLHYGRKIPHSILKLHPEKRYAFLAIVHRRIRGGHFSYRSVIGIKSVDSLRIVNYLDNGREEVDMLIMGRDSGIGYVDNAMVISSRAHRVLSFELTHKDIVREERE